MDDYILAIVFALIFIALAIIGGISLVTEVHSKLIRLIRRPQCQPIQSKKAVTATWRELSTGRSLTYEEFNGPSKEIQRGRFGRCDSCFDEFELVNTKAIRGYYDGVWDYTYYCPKCYKEEKPYRGRIIGANGKAIMDQYCTISYS
ncbi:MAG: hypothetical protein AB1711_05390 [Thermodesulfobacteriota bacterium]